MKSQDQYFNIGPYRFMFGPSVRDGETVFAPKIHGFTLWMWNGYYWQIEIADAHDLDGARNTMQHTLSFRKMDMEKVTV